MYAGSWIPAEMHVLAHPEKVFLEYRRRCQNQSRYLLLRDCLTPNGRSVSSVLFHLFSCLWALVQDDMDDMDDIPCPTLAHQPPLLSICSQSTS